MRPAEQNNQQLQNEIQNFIFQVDKLKLEYDQYFQGLTKREPYALHEKIKEQLRKFSDYQPTHTPLKFRLQQTIAKYNTYKQLWSRTLREIEEGRYQPDIFKAQLHERARLAEEKKKLAQREPQKSKSQLDPFQKLYVDYLHAKKQNGENIQGISFNAFKNGINKQKHIIATKTGHKDIWFKVSKSPEGKTLITAIAKK